MTPIEFSNHVDVDKIQEGTILSRTAMRELPQAIRSAVGMMHFAGVTQILRDKWDSRDPLERWAALRVVHYVRDQSTRILRIGETSGIEFLFGVASKERITLKQIKECDPLFQWTSPNPAERHNIVQSMLDTVGTEQYSLLRQNCEHWMRRVTEPPQEREKWLQICASVQIALCLAVLVLFLVLLFFFVLFVKRRRQKQKTRETPPPVKEETVEI